MVQWPDLIPLTVYMEFLLLKEKACSTPIFALWAAYNTEQYNVPNFNIRLMERFHTNLGWYNHIPGQSTSDQEEANFEIQFNLNNDSFRIVHGQLGNFSSLNQQCYGRFY